MARQHAAWYEASDLRGSQNIFSGTLYSGRAGISASWTGNAVVTPVGSMSSRYRRSTPAR
jgi:hypothetical protein